METVEMTEKVLADLRTAFKFNQFDTECYLDVEEGRVIWFSADAPAAEEPDEGDPDWKHEAYEKRMAVWNDEEGRYLEVPPSDITDACEDMEAYLEEAGGRLAEQFAGAGFHRRSFETFKRRIEEDPVHKEKWREFREWRVEERIEEWLELQGYEVVVRRA